MENKGWNGSQKRRKNRLFIPCPRCRLLPADNQVIQLCLALDVCVARCRAPPSEPAVPSEPRVVARVGWSRGASGVSTTRRPRGICVIYSASDDNGLMVLNASPLGALSKSHITQFYSSTFCTNSFVGGEKCLLGHNGPGNLVFFLPPASGSAGSLSGSTGMGGRQDGNEAADFF